MRNSLTIIIASCFLVIGLFQSSHGQQTVPTSVAAAEDRGTREQDGLAGPVRRVRVESARMMVKGGKMFEGPRMIRGITTYDPAGKKVDAVDYPIESSTVSGNERYRYDDKGNIVEMVVVDSGGAILSKEAYEYEFDPIGNWTTMNTSVAVYENGKVTFEPTEVTYRTISYYYNQAIEKLSNATAKSKAGSLRSTSSPRVESPSDAKVPTKSVTTNPPVVEKVAEDVKDKATDPVPVAPAAKQTTEAVANNVAVPIESKTSTAAAIPTVFKVEEAVLRSAAIDLPNPEYPEAALVARAAGKVEVQLLINEKGLVSNARAQSGNPLLNQAAENAALKARFTPKKLSAEPTIAFGVITYNFTLPEAPTISSNPTTERTALVAKQQKVAQVQPQERTAFVTPRPVTVSETKTNANPEPAVSNYDKGLALLAAGDYAKAAEVFNQAVQANPNDANAYVKLATSYSRMNKNKEAIAGYKMAAQIQRTAVDAAAYHSWGRSYLALEKNSDAISAFKQALSLMRADTIDPEPKTIAMPSPAQVHFDLGTAYINSRRFSDSIKEFKQVVALSPANAEAHYALAIAYISDGNRRAAEDVNKVLATLNRALAEKIAFALVAPESRHGCRNISCR
jgi:TonB family protein